mgnify:CR=1 FL=1
MQAVDLLKIIQAQVEKDPGLLLLTAVQMAISDLQSSRPDAMNMAIWRIINDLDKLDHAARKAFGDTCQQLFRDSKVSQ